MPKVSILMPVFNSDRYLKESIESILNQTFKDFELVIVNDGSTDNSEKVILSFNDKRIKYYKSFENKGVTFSRKLMVEKSSGEYIAFLDSDDIANPKRLEIQTLFLDNNRKFALCGTWATLVNENGEKIKDLNTPVDHDEIRCMLLFRNAFVQSSVMIRRELLSEETYDTEFPIAEDYDLWCRLSMGYKMRNIPLHLTKQRIHDSGISIKKEEEMYVIIKNIYKRELVNLAIYANQNELNTHLALRNKNIVDINNKEFFKSLKRWLHKMTGANQLCRVYNHDTFRATICLLWIYACVKRKNYFRIPFFPIAINAKILNKLTKMIIRIIK